MIDNVPARVCPMCGDVVFNLDTIHCIEAILQNAGRPDRKAPVYEYA